MFASIRWRLVASYVLLSLLAVGLTGSLALALVRHSSIQRETAFLAANAEALALRAEPLVVPMVHTPALDALARSSAFLIDARVRILDSGARVLVDSGPKVGAAALWVGGEPMAPGEPAAPGQHLQTDEGEAGATWTRHIELVTGLTPGTAEITSAHRVRIPFEAALALREGDRSPDDEAFVAAEAGSAAAGGSAEPRDQVIIVQPLVPGASDRVRFELRHDAVASFAALHPSEGLPAAARALPAALVTSTLSGLPGLTGSPGLPATVPVSERFVRVPIGRPGQPGAMIGFVEISQGPDFAAEALANSRRAFTVAALVAGLLAGIVGLIVSRGMTAPLAELTEATERMSAGDLAVRAPVRSQDEIGQLARQFNGMAGRLEQSFSALEAERDALRRFVADASHELRTPITALRNFNELLLDEAGADPATRSEFLAESRIQLDRLAWMTANLLDLSRWDAGLVALDRQPCDAAELIAAAAAPFRARAEERGIHLSLRPPEPPLGLTVDAQRIEMALANLLDNALKLTPSGGSVEIGAERVEAAPGGEEVGTEADQGYGTGGAQGRGASREEPAAPPAIRLWVRDTGPGVDPEDLPHLFERFYRGRVPGAAEPVSPAAAGSGLGLAIVASIVQAHGGHVAVESCLGAGSTFSLELPAG